MRILSNGFPAEEWSRPLRWAQQSQTHQLLLQRPLQLSQPLLQLLDALKDRVVVKVVLGSKVNLTATTLAVLGLKVNLLPWQR